MKTGQKDLLGRGFTGNSKRMKELKMGLCMVLRIFLYDTNVDIKEPWSQRKKIIEKKFIS